MLLKAKGGMSTSEDNTEDGRYKTQVTGHRSHVIVLRIQKVFYTFVKANLRPNWAQTEGFRPKVSFYECLGYFLYW